MPRPKIKTRIEHLADAHSFLLRAQQSLGEVDLRTTTGDLRAAIRTGREQTAAALAALQTAITHDVPPTRTRKT